MSAWFQPGKTDMYSQHPVSNWSCLHALPGITITTPPMDSVLGFGAPTLGEGKDQLKLPPASQ